MDAERVRLGPVHTLIEVEHAVGADSNRGWSFALDSSAGSTRPGMRIPAKALKTISIEPDAWHGDWNYVIRPHKKSRSVDFRIRGP